MVEEPKVVVETEPAPVPEVDANGKPVSELTLKQKRMVRAFRFGNNEDADCDPNEALNKIEEE